MFHTVDNFLEKTGENLLNKILYFGLVRQEKLPGRQEIATRLARWLCPADCPPSADEMLPSLQGKPDWPGPHPNAASQCGPARPMPSWPSLAATVRIESW
jgi:hypothetical protein